MNLFGKNLKMNVQNLQSSKQTKDANSGEVAALENKMDQERNEIDEAIKALGKIYFESYRNDSNEKLVPICNMIDESYRVIKMCEKQILFLKGIQICHNCNATLDIESVFCNKCGTKLDAVEEVNLNDDSDSSITSAGTELVKCHECGSTMPGDIIFCTNCGVKMKLV